MMVIGKLREIYTQIDVELARLSGVKWGKCRRLSPVTNFQEQLPQKCFYKLSCIMSEQPHEITIRNDSCRHR
jgi:hypothetical protein